MKKYSGNLLTYLNDHTKIAVAKQNSKYSIVNIDVNKIIPNKKNFYGIRDVEALAASMALSGHVSPLEVTPIEDGNGNYRLISGERRRAAVLLRLERGEIDCPEVPCIVRDDIKDSDKLTAEQIEIINIICANDFREKTPFEKLDEILFLEPIARIYYEEQKSVVEGKNNFRKFFAEEFLGISEGTLQRSLVLKKLVTEAREAFDKGLIGKTALSELAYKPEQAQRDYLAKLIQGEASGTIDDVRKDGKYESDDGSLVDASDGDDAVKSDYNEATNMTGEYGDDDSSERTHCEQPISSTSPSVTKKSSSVSSEKKEEFTAMSPDEAQKEANNWVADGICKMMFRAAEEAKKAKENNDKLAAAQWDLRRAAANLVLETIK